MRIGPPDDDQQPARPFRPQVVPAHAANFAELTTPEMIHACPCCRLPRLHMLDAQAMADHWQMTVRCPDCEWVYTGAFDAHQVSALADAEDRASRMILTDAKLMQQARHDEAAEQFGRALADGEITPDDFAF